MSRLILSSKFNQSYKLQLDGLTITVRKGHFLRAREIKSKGDRKKDLHYFDLMGTFDVNA